MYYIMYLCTKQNFTYRKKIEDTIALPRNKRFFLKFCPAKMLQNLLYFCNKKTYFIFFLMNVDIDYLGH